MITWNKEQEVQLVEYQFECLSRTVLFAGSSCLNELPYKYEIHVSTIVVKTTIADPGLYKLMD